MDNKNESLYESNNAYFNYWNEEIKKGRQGYMDPLNSYKKFSSFNYSKFIKVEDPLKITEEKIKDLVTGKVDKIFVTISGEFKGIFQLLDNERDLIDLVPEKLTVDLDYFDCFFVNSFKENKNVYSGYLDVIQHQELSIKWFIEVLKEKQLVEEERYGDYWDHSLTDGFLSEYYDMIAFADTTGLNADGMFSDEEIGLIRHGVSLSYQKLSGKSKTFDISAAAACSEFVGGDIKDEVYFKYK